MPRFPTVIDNRKGGFQAYSKFLAVKYKKRLTLQMEREMRKIMKDIKAIQPVDTGASAGSDVRAKSEMFKWHPAFGMNIGNDVGDSGWQVHTDEAAGTVKLKNPMWTKYLKFLEAGTARGTYRTGFVAESWLKHLARRKDTGYAK